MDSQQTLFSVNPEDLIIKITAGDSDAAVMMGLLWLTGLRGKQDLDQACSYLVKAKQLGAKNADVLIAYVFECNGRMTEAIDTYVGKEPQRKKDGPIVGVLRQRFERVGEERKRLQEIISEYGLPKCPMNTSLNSLLESLDSGSKSLSDICSILSYCDDTEHWCEDTAWLFFEEEEWELAKIWMKKSHEDEKWLFIIQDKLKRKIVTTPEVVEIEGPSLLGRKLSSLVFPENEEASQVSFKQALNKWGQECKQIRDNQCRLEEEERALQERLMKEAEEKAKKEAEEAARNEDMRKNSVGPEREGAISNNNLIDDKKNELILKSNDDNKVQKLVLWGLLVAIVVLVLLLILRAPDSSKSVSSPQDQHSSVSIPKPLSFKGIPITGSTSAFGAELVRAGFKAVGNGTYTGNFAGYSGCKVTPSGNPVKKVRVDFPVISDWDALEKAYDSLQASLTQKYGKNPIVNQNLAVYHLPNGTISLDADVQYQSTWHVIVIYSNDL